MLKSLASVHILRKAVVLRETSLLTMKSTRNARHLVIFLLLIFCPGALAFEQFSNTCTARMSALSPHKEKRLRATRRQLKTLKKAFKCLRRKSRSLEQLNKSLNEIRKCVYNGLSYAKYAAQRVICRERSEQLERLRKATRRCQRHSNTRKCWRRSVVPLRMERARILRACDEIGWNGQERKCKKMGPVKREIEQTQDLQCGTSATVKSLRKRIAMLEERAKRLEGLNGPSVSNTPRRKW